jgi:hypothetical protein
VGSPLAALASFLRSPLVLPLARLVGAIAPATAPTAGSLPPPSGSPAKLAAQRERVDRQRSTPVGALDRTRLPLIRVLLPYVGGLELDQSGSDGESNALFGIPAPPESRYVSSGHPGVVATARPLVTRVASSLYSVASGRSLGTHTAQPFMLARDPSER